MPRRLSDAQLRALLKRLGSLAEESDRGAATEVVRDALRTPIPMLRARAAQAARAARLQDLTPDLLTAYDEAFEDPVKSDPGCHVKLACLEALDFADHEDAAPFLRAIVYRQEESSFDGGRTDTAGALRARAAFALVRLHHPEVLPHLADLLVDQVSVAREAAAQALAYHGDPHGAALLRLRMRFPEPDPDVAIECLKAYLELDPAGALPLAGDCLSSDVDSKRSGAALALGESRLEAALPLLIDYVANITEDRELRVALMSIATLRTADAHAHLLAQVAGAPGERALHALEALTPYLRDGEARAAAQAAAARNPDPAVKQAARS